MSRSSYPSLSPVVRVWVDLSDISSARPDAPVRSDVTLRQRVTGRGRVLRAHARRVVTGYRSAGRGGRDVVGAPMWSK